MKKIQPLSFVLGIISGVLLLTAASAVTGLLHGSSAPIATAGAGSRQFGGNGGPNIARMAQRFGMTEADLQKELDSGKTMQQIAQEKGVQFGGGVRRPAGSGAVQTGSGVRLQQPEGAPSSIPFTR